MWGYISAIYNLSCDKLWYKIVHFYVCWKKKKKSNMKHMFKSFFFFFWKGQFSGTMFCTMQMCKTWSTRLQRCWKTITFLPWASYKIGSRILFYIKLQQEKSPSSIHFVTFSMALSTKEIGRASCRERV